MTNTCTISIIGTTELSVPLTLARLSQVVFLWAVSHSFAAISPDFKSLEPSRNQVN